MYVHMYLVNYWVYEKEKYMSSIYGYVIYLNHAVGKQRTAVTWQLETLTNYVELVS